MVKRHTEKRPNPLTAPDVWTHYEGPYYPIGNKQYQFEEGGKRTDPKDQDYERYSLDKDGRMFLDGELIEGV